MDEEMSQILGHEFKGDLDLDAEIDEKAAAEFLGIATRTLTTWRAKGTGPAFTPRLPQSQGARKNKNKIIALWTSCLHTFPVKMSCCPACTRKLIKNIVPFMVTFD
jgi:hypothetical protein